MTYIASPFFVAWINRLVVVAKQIACSSQGLPLREIAADPSGCTGIFGRATGELKCAMVRRANILPGTFIILRHGVSSITVFVGELVDVLVVNGFHRKLLLCSGLY